MKIALADLYRPEGAAEPAVATETPIDNGPPTGPATYGISVATTVNAALDGRLSPEHTRKYYANKRLKPKHMKILRMAVAGYTNREIAERLGYTEGRISILLNHQDSRAVMAHMVGEAANALGVSERLQAVAPEALEHVITTMRSTKDDRLRSKNAFEILDRSGFGPSKTVEINDKRAPSLNDSVASKLASVLEKTLALRSEPYNPTQRSLPAAAVALIGSAPVIVVEPAGADSTAGGDTSQRVAPPDSEQSQAPIPEEVLSA